MEATGLTLFTHPYSWYAQRVRLALEEKGIPYTPIDVDMANKPEALLEANPIYNKFFKTLDSAMTSVSTDGPFFTGRNSDF
ncbi:unnamed protein product [Calypogeia fissa]